MKGISLKPIALAVLRHLGRSSYVSTTKTDNQVYGIVASSMRVV